MDKLAELIFSNPTVLWLFLLASPTAGFGLYIGYHVVQKLRNGNGDVASTKEPTATLSVLHGELMAVKAILEQLLNRLRAFDDAISALRKENVNHSSVIADIRERVAAVEASLK